MKDRKFKVIYIEPGVHEELKVKALLAHLTMGEYVKMLLDRVNKK